MKKKDVLLLYNALMGLSDLKGVKFNYAISKNINIVKTEVDLIRDTLKDTELYKEYDGKREELARKHAKKDAKGVPIIQGGNYTIEEPDKFEADLKVLDKENEQAISERREQFKGYEALLEEESEIELFKINMDEIPSDINTEQMRAIYLLINE